MLISTAYVLRTIGEKIAYPLLALGPVIGLLLMAALMGVLALIGFRYTANPRSLRTAKDRIQGGLLGIVLFRHDTTVMFGEEKRLVLGALAYMKSGLIPLAVILVPMIVLFAPLNLCYSYRPVQPGESTILTLKAATGRLQEVAQATLEASDGLIVETPPLRIPSRREICWRLRAVQAGVYVAKISLPGGSRYSKSVVVGSTSKKQPLSPSRVRAGFWAALFESGEAPLPRTSPVDSIEVEYATSYGLRIGPWTLNWIVWFLLATMIVVLALRGYLKVEL